MVNTNVQTIHQMGLGINAMVKQATGRESVSSIEHDWVSVEQLARYIYGSESGDIVSFDTNIADGIVSLIAYITALQDLHGYDNPWPAGGGKNLIPVSNSNSSTVNDVAWTNNNDGSYKANGTASANSYFGNSSIGISIGVLPAGDYTVSASHSDGSLSTDILMRIGKGSSSTLESINVSPVTFTADGTSEYFVAFRIDSGVTVSNETIFVQVESGSTYSDWVPYANICPISGWTGANVSRTGKNLFDGTVTSQKYINLNGEEVDNASWCITDYVPVLGGGKVAYSGLTNVGTAPYCAFYDIGKKLVSTFKHETGDNKTANVPASAKYVRFSVQNSQAEIDKLIITTGTSVGDYEAYHGTTYPITWQTEAGTVYGGTLDVLTGVLTVEYGIAELGDLAWSVSSDNVSFISDTAISGIKTPASQTAVADAICSNYKVYKSTDMLNGTFGVAPSGKIKIRDDAFSLNTTNFTTAMNGVQLVYRLATPVTYQLTPQQVSSLIGENNIIADTGNVSVQYKVKEDLL